MLCDVAVRPLVSQIALLHRTEGDFILQGDAQQRGQLVRESPGLAGPNLWQLIGEANGSREKKSAGAARGGQSAPGPLGRGDLRREMLPADRQNQTLGPPMTGHRVRMINTRSRPAS